MRASLVWLGSFAAVALAAAAACGDDDDGVGAGGADAGADAPVYAPAPPPVPLECAAAGTFDPCDAGLDPSVYGATQPDGGALASTDAGGLADAGRVAAACVASGAIRIACANDGGAARFDLAAGDDGSSLAVAHATFASRFDIGADGAMSPVTALDARSEDVAIVSGAGGVATIVGATSNSHVRVRRDGSPHDDFVPLPARLDERSAIYGAGIADDGTVIVLLHGGDENLLTLPVTYDGLHPNLAPGHGAQSLYVAPNGDWVAAGPGVDVYRKSGATQIATGAQTFVFATGLDGQGHALVAGYHDDAVEVYAARSDEGADFVRMRVAREPWCGLDHTGCGYTCTENVRVPVGSSGSFVRLDDGDVYFVYPEASIVRERRYAIDHDAACDLLGGCACKATADLKSVGDVDAVVMQVLTAPYQLVERARAHLALTDPMTTLLDGRPGNGLKAVPRGSKIHVLLQGSRSEMARVVLDLGK